MRRILALLALSVLGTGAAMAQDRVDLDSDGNSRPAARSRTAKKEVVREVVRGPYLKASVGSTIYLGNRGAGARSSVGRSILRPGTTLMLTAGGEFIDKDRLSVGAEFTFYQAIHNGLSYIDQGDFGIGPNQLIQGDIHSFAAMVGIEASAYPIRRFGIGGRVGGGVAFVPLLMDKFYYDQDVVGLSQGAGEWGGPQNRPPVHQGVKPAIYAGPTFEYYTKLSHFSIGADVDFLYIIGLDFGLAVSGYLKYTF